MSHEETVFGDEGDTYKELRLRSMVSGFPDPQDFGVITQRYNMLDMTYDEDALPGISGLLSVLSRSFAGGFLFGLPIMFFDQALGWKPFRGSNLRRRVSSSRPAEEQLQPSGMPSWSWIGWHGAATTSTDEGIRARYLTKTEETISITECILAKTRTNHLAHRFARADSSIVKNLKTYQDR